MLKYSPSGAPYMISNKVLINPSGKAARRTRKNHPITRKLLQCARAGESIVIKEMNVPVAHFASLKPEPVQLELCLSSAESHIPPHHPRDR